MSQPGWPLLAGPAAGLITWGLCLLAGLDNAAAITAGVTLVCVLWWILEPVPIPVTALLPLSLLPLLGVLDGGQVAAALGSPIVQLMLGGFILSRAMEHTGTHRRLALGMVGLCGGGSSRRLVIGFLLASAALSMWISNTATALMLLPVALAVLERADDRRLALPLLLAIAYGASVGGIGTPIGTPPNLIFMQIYQDTTGQEISFLRWMSWGLPVVAVFLPLIALWLTRSLGGGGAVSLPAIGAWRVEERRVLVIFGATALAWMTRTEPFGGWSQWLGLPGASDAAVALLAVIALFLTSNGQGGRLLTWEKAVQIPWGILLLFAGGLALAAAFSSSGLSAIIGNALAGLSNLPLALLVLAICLGVTFMTETTSNTASATLLMPLLAAAAIGAGLEPALLMIPAAMSASCAFMLPVATPPNSIVFGSGALSVRDMAREGLVLNLIGAVVITLLTLLLIQPMLAG